MDGSERASILQPRHASRLGGNSESQPIGTQSRRRHSPNERAIYILWCDRCRAVSFISSNDTSCFVDFCLVSFVRESVAAQLWCNRVYRNSSRKINNILNHKSNKSIHYRMREAFFSHIVFMMLVCFHDNLWYSRRLYLYLPVIKNTYPFHLYVVKLCVFCFLLFR